MAAPCSEILNNYFPSIGPELRDYITGIIDGSADEFETSDDLYDAIGDMLLENEEEQGENEIREMCQALLNIILTKNGNGDVGPRRVLDAPVQLASMAENFDEEEVKTSSIWIKSRNKDSTVCAKKLAKAEQMLLKKQGKQDEMSRYVKPKAPLMNEASASQQVNRKDDKLESSGGNKTYDVHISNFDLSFGEKVLLSGADLHMNFGRRYGLCGRNGIGKTTMLRMLHNGQLRIPSHITVLHVEQEVVGDDTEALQSVLECDEKREALLKEEREITLKLNSTSPTANNDAGDLGTRISEIYQELEAMESDKAPARAGCILSGLGFSADGQKRATRTYSGGWRMRLALARALFTKPDLLLLDEPTNMLDMKAILWLEGYLQTWQTTILCVSHDRQFLNSIATDILYMHTKVIDHYRGDYDMFVKTRDDRNKCAQKEYDAQLEYRQHIQVFIDRFRYNANRAAQVQSKLKLLERLPELKPIEKEAEVVLRFPECEVLNPPILQLDNLTFHYDKEKPIFKNVEVCAGVDSRICIVGENGAGKTTLLKILLGDLTPTDGMRVAHRGLRIGYFSQHHVDQLEMNQNSVEVLQSRLPGKQFEFYRRQLGSFGVSGELALRPVASLSGGQKSRVAFANLAMQSPNFFILDEPTNHLDVESIEALGRSLLKFKGGCILVTHDERLISMVCQELWLCQNHTIRRLEGGINEYKEIIKAELDQQQHP